MKKSFFAITISCLLATVPLYGIAMPTATNEPLALTLEDAVALALRNNPDIEKADLGRISQKFNLVVAKYQFEPQAALTGSASYTNTVSNGSSSYSKEWGITPGATLENHYGTDFKVASTNTVTNGVYNPQLELEVTQPLIRGFGKAVVEAALENAKDTQVIDKLNFKSQAINTVTTVINDYLSLVETYQTLEVDNVSLKNFEQTVENDKAMIAAGRMAKSDIVQAKAQVATQQATIASDLNSITAGKNTLLNDIGLPPTTNLTLPKKFNFYTVKNLILGDSKLPGLEESENIALGNNISYQTDIITLRTLRRSLLVDKDQRRWKLDVTGTETFGGGSGGGANAGVKSLFNGRNHAESVEADLTVPIDDVNTQQTVINAEVGLDQAIVGLRQTKRQLITDVESQYNTVLTNAENLKLSLNALKLQEESVYIAQQKALAGQVSTFEVITNQKNLATQRQSVVESEITYLQSLVTYEQTLGITLEPWRIRVRY